MWPLIDAPTFIHCVQTDLYSQEHDLTLAVICCSKRQRQPKTDRNFTLRSKLSLHDWRQKMRELTRRKPPFELNRNELLRKNWHFTFVRVQSCGLPIVPSMHASTLLRMNYSVFQTIWKHIIQTPSPRSRDKEEQFPSNCRQYVHTWMRRFRGINFLCGGRLVIGGKRCKWSVVRNRRILRNAFIIAQKIAHWEGVCPRGKNTQLRLQPGAWMDRDHMNRLRSRWHEVAYK